MSELSRLPVWTPIDLSTDEHFDMIYEALDSQGRAWRMWYVENVAPSDPFPPGWRFAPVDALEEANFIDKLGGGREFDLAAIRIDAGEVVRDASFQRSMGWNEPQAPAPPEANRSSRMEQVTLCTGERVAKPVFITSLIALSDLHQLNPDFLAEAYDLAVNPQHSLAPSAWDALEAYVLIINGKMPADVRQIVVAAAGGSRPHMYLRSRDEILADAE